MRKIILLKYKILTTEEQKILSERIPYLDNNIKKIFIRKNVIKIYLNNYSRILFSKLKKKYQKLSNLLKIQTT